MYLRPPLTVPLGGPTEGFLLNGIYFIESV